MSTLSTDIQTSVQTDLVRGRDLQLLAKHVVDGFLAGLHRSAQRGSSAQFKQHRPYSPGDDLRSVDWKMFARSDRYYIREFEDETNLRAALLVDTSGSMAYGDGDACKLTYAVRLAAVFGHFLLGQQDAVGLGTFGGDLDTFLPGKTTPRHWQTMLEQLAALGPQKQIETKFDSLFDGLLPKLARHHRRGLVILITDCFGDLDQLARGLTQLRTARHETLVFQVVHRDELDLPFSGQVRFEGLESKTSREIDADLLRAAYRKKLAEFEADLAKAAGQSRTHVEQIVTDQPLSEALRKMLIRRGRKRGRR